MTETRSALDIWKEIEHDVDIYKFFIGTIIKSAGFIFAITGAMTAYALANKIGSHLVLLSLILPVIINSGFAFICHKSIPSAEMLRENHSEICKEVGLRKPYNLRPLTDLLRFCSIIFSVSSIGLIVLLIALFQTADLSLVGELATPQEQAK